MPMGAAGAGWVRPSPPIGSASMGGPVGSLLKQPEELGGAVVASVGLAEYWGGGKLAVGGMLGMLGVPWDPALLRQGSSICIPLSSHVWLRSSAASTPERFRIGYLPFKEVALFSSKIDELLEGIKKTKPR